MGKIKALLVWLMVGLVSFPVWSQDSVKVVQYADTFKLQDQPVALSDESLIWTTLHLQQKNKQLEDSIRQLLDSIAQLQRFAALACDTTLQDHVETSVMDTIEYRYEHIAQLLAEEKQLDRSAIEPSIFKDLQEDMDDLNRSLKKPKYWSRELNCLAQFTQNYISPNWYKGGKSSFAAIAQAKGFYNYSKDRLVWENTLDWKVGASTTGDADTLRKYNITDDQFRLQSKVGYQLIEQLYIMGSVELNTTLFNSWKANVNALSSGFMTPLKFYINGGVDYRPISDLQINFSPTVYKLMYAHYDDPGMVDFQNLGLKEGQRRRSEFGSSIRLNYLWKPVREVRVDTEFYFYTNYRGVEIDWEINCDFIINRFLSTRLTLHPRYATEEVRDGDERAKMQFKELLSIGFNHKFR